MAKNEILGKVNDVKGGRSMSNLERLYYNMDKLVDDWADGAEVRAASDRLEMALGDELYMKYEDEICNCTSENHKDGFVKGFEYAVSLFATGKAVSA